MCEFFFFQTNTKNLQDSVMGPAPQMSGESTSYTPPVGTSLLVS